MTASLHSHTPAFSYFSTHHYTSAMADSMLDYLLCAGRLKRTPRTGWVMREVDRPESVAEHQFRLALMAMSLADKFGGAGVIDRDRAIRMCLVRFFLQLFSHVY
jgi:hypothetical protein